VMSQMLHPLKVRQPSHSTRHKLPHRQHPISVRVQSLQHRVDDLGRLSCVNFEVFGPFALLLVVYAVD
jgi:hypothetical protein